MKKKNGFTLIELLAVIVILAIILVIAVPKILDTIEAARKSSMEDSAKLIATQAEKQWLVEQATGGDVTAITCATVADFTAADYGTCTFTLSNTGKITAFSINASSATGKFAGYTCTGTSSSAITCTKASS